MLCYKRLLAEHMADVSYAVKTVRAQRPGMVENSVREFYYLHVYISICVISGAIWVYSPDTIGNNTTSLYLLSLNTQFSFL